MKEINSTLFSYYNHEMDNSFFMDDLWGKNPTAVLALRGITPIGIGLPDEFFMKSGCLGLYCEIEGEDFPKWFHISVYMLRSFFPEGSPDWIKELVKTCKERSEEYKDRFKGVYFPQ